MLNWWKYKTQTEKNETWRIEMIFWAVAPRIIYAVCQCFRGTCWLHHQGWSTGTQSKYYMVQQPRRSLQPWWLRQYVPLQQWDTDKILYGTTLHMTSALMTETKYSPQTVAHCQNTAHHNNLDQWSASGVPLHSNRYPVNCS